MNSSVQLTLKLSVFLIGILMGSLDNSIVIPARTVIQSQFSISSETGIWTITIYTLVSAVAMPLMAKLADRRGRKSVFITCISLFAIGSLLAGLTNSIPALANFGLFLFARSIQAIGAGGLIPIATAEISQAFPDEKRGRALGMIGGVYGVASILGPTLGSFILQLAGTAKWGWLFFINIPLSIVAIAMATRVTTHKAAAQGRFDFPGAITLSLLVASLLHALTNVNFFALQESLSSRGVFPFLISAAALLPLLIAIERKATDPILNLDLFKDMQTVLVFVLSFIVGIRFMYVMFIPQFAENALMLKTGSGGYLVAFLALFAAISAPVGGALIDKFGAKDILSAGFVVHIVGFLELAYVVPKYMNLASVLVGFACVGIGMGLTIGTPINYLLLQRVPAQNAASGLATLSLVRSVGITLSPGILVGFLAHANKNMLPQFRELFPKLEKVGTAEGPSTEFVRELFQNADVTNIMEKVRSLVPPDVQERIGWMLDLATPMVQDIFQKTLNKGFSNMFVTVAILSAVGFVLAELLKSSIKKT